MSAHRANLLGLLILGTIWAMVLVIGGAVVAVDPPEAWGWMGLAARLGGIAAIAGGQFVFLVVVADRLCPGANRAVVASVEGISGGLFAAALIATILALAVGASS